MIQLKFNLTLLERLRQRFSRSRKALIKEKLQGIAEECWNITKEMAPRGKTGKLKESIALKSTGNLSWSITEGVPYGPWVRKGVTIPDIYPRYKKALWWKGLPHPVAWTHGHRNKANPYDERAMSAIEARMPRRLDSLGATLVADLEKD